MEVTLLFLVRVPITMAYGTFHRRSKVMLDRIDMKFHECDNEDFERRCRRAELRAYSDKLLRRNQELRDRSSRLLSRSEQLRTSAKHAPRPKNYVETLARLF